MIDIGNAKRKRPQTKLTIAFPLVSVVPEKAGGALVGDAEAEATSLPQTRQNRSPGETVFPHAAQNMMGGPSWISARQQFSYCRNFSKHYSSPCGTSI
jgi:hypothetical protein